jgi:hypothetical protein
LIHSALAFVRRLGIDASGLSWDNLRINPTPGAAQGKVPGRALVACKKSDPDLLCDYSNTVACRNHIDRHATSRDWLDNQELQMGIAVPEPSPSTVAEHVTLERPIAPRLFARALAKPA